MPKFKVTYARVVVMCVEIDADDEDEALSKAAEMEKAGEMPGIYPVPSHLPSHVKDIQDYEPIWEAERVEE